MGKTKILFLGDLGGGGKERRMSELIRYLSAVDGYQLYLMLDKDTPKDYPQTLNYVRGYKEMDFNCGLLQRLMQVRGYVQELKPDIVHSWHEYLSLYIDLQKWVLPNFFYIAGFVADANRDGYLRDYADRLTYFLSDVVISNSMAGLHAHHAPMKKSRVIYNGFNRDRLPSEDREQSTRNSLGLNNERVVVMAGRMQKGKDYDVFLDAIKILNTRRNDVKYVLIGQGALRERYEERVNNEQISNVIFAGFRKDIEYVFQIADISVLCTDDNHKEGVSNVIMESMAAGLPVIATNAGGTPEIVEDGKNGYLIKVRDRKALSDKIDLILNDNNLRDMLSHGAKSTIDQKFSIAKMVNDYVDVYKQATKSNK